MNSKLDIFHNCRIIANEHLGNDVYLLSIELSLPDFPKPGSFLHVKPLQGSDPLFRRAFSIFDYDPQKEIVDVLYKVFGRGTKIMSRLKSGEFLDCLGPLGNGFPLPENNQKIICVSGGVGLPPLYLFIKRCLEQGLDPDKISFLCGLTTKEEEVIANRLNQLPVKLFFSTDDGTLGHKGFVTELLEIVLSEVQEAPLIYTCGPEGMLKAVQQICHKADLKCLLSLESIMPCGVGTCLGCVVSKSDDDSYLRVCHDGPVFDSHEVEL